MTVLDVVKKRFNDWIFNIVRECGRVGFPITVSVEQSGEVVEGLHYNIYNINIEKIDGRFFQIIKKESDKMRDGFRYWFLYDKKKKQLVLFLFPVGSRKLGKKICS